MKEKLRRMCFHPTSPRFGFYWKMMKQWVNLGVFGCSWFYDRLWCWLYRSNRVDYDVDYVDQWYRLEAKVKEYERNRNDKREYFFYWFLWSYRAPGPFLNKKRINGAHTPLSLAGTNKSKNDELKALYTSFPSSKILPWRPGGDNPSVIGVLWRVTVPHYIRPKQCWNINRGGG